MLFNTSSVPIAAIQDVSGAFNVQTPASLSVAANCSVIQYYIVRTVLSKQFVDFSLLLPRNLDCGGGGYSCIQIVFFITSIRGAAEPQNLVTFSKI